MVRSSKTPRLDADNRRLARFYEPLVLLHILDPNGSQRIPRAVEETDAHHKQLRELRQIFLDQLAYVCDNIKGGDTVTAIALEAQPSGVTFWVASNNSVPMRTISHLEAILSTLRSLASCPTETSSSAKEAEISDVCIEFNLPRIKDYQKLLRRPLQQCLAALKSSNDPTEETLVDFLEGFRAFNDDDLSGLCHFSYQQRSCQGMKSLQTRIGDGPMEMTESESTGQAFLLTHHYIGRLGSHLKAAKLLVASALRMPGLFDSFNIKTRPSPKQHSSPPPTDHLTNLQGILKRMLPKDSGKMGRYQEALLAMDSMFKIQDRLHALYQDREFRPRVHAELNLLEYFYAKNMSFIDDHRFIGCSKPACYCCYHYISHHPGGFVRPSSHAKRYLSWRPPDPIDATDATEIIHLRDVLNEVIVEVRRDVLRHIEQRRGPSQWRPDSTTGITYSGSDGVSRRGGGRSEVDDAGIIVDHSELDRARADTSAGPSSGLSPLSGSEQMLVGERQEATDSDSDSDGGVLLT